MPSEVLITRRATFAAGHVLSRPDWDDARNREVFGACSTEHGHNYVLEVTVAGQVGPDGMVINLKDLDRIVRERVVSDVDHRHLNRDVQWMSGTLPTTENLALAIWSRLDGCVDGARLERVRVTETENNSAEVRR